MPRYSTSSFIRKSFINKGVFQCLFIFLLLILIIVLLFPIFKEKFSYYYNDVNFISPPINRLLPDQIESCDTACNYDNEMCKLRIPKNIPDSQKEMESDQCDWDYNQCLNMCNVGHPYEGTPY